MQLEDIRPVAERRDLLQTFRAMQAVAEAGYRILVPRHEIDRWEYASNWFDLSYGLDDRRGRSVDVAIDHNRPEVSIGGLSRPLLFPHAVLDRFAISGGPRSIAVSFLGHMSKSRRRTLRRWSSANRLRSHTRRAQRRFVILDSVGGRSWPRKAWDQKYAELLAASQFVLCPDGDYVWTYRFFEAIAAGAIPIVETGTPLYRGFRFATMNEPLESLRWSEAVSAENVSLLRQSVACRPEELRAAVESASRSD